MISGDIPLLSIIFEEDRHKFQLILKQRLASRSKFWEYSYRIYSKNEDIRIIKSYTYIKQDHNDSRVSIFSYLYDQTEIQKELNMHISLEHRCARAIDSAGEGVWEWELKRNEVFFSKHWKKMLGFEEHELPNEFNEWRKRIHPHDVEKMDVVIENHIKNRSEIIECEHRLLHADGTYRWILGRGKAVERDSRGFAKRMIGTHIDITERKEMEILLHRRNEELERLVEQVKELSITDHLTSLFNRRKMVEEIRKAQNRFEMSGKSFTLAILDLDYFKNINDQYGHTFGDIALQTFANLLKRKINDPNVVARWGGEEFIILFQNNNTQDILRQLLSLQECCNEELLKYRMNPVPLSFSAGVFEYAIKQSMENILKRADQALYNAKSLGRKQIILYKKGLPIV